MKAGAKQPGQPGQLGGQQRQAGRREAQRDGVPPTAPPLVKKPSLPLVLIKRTRSFSRSEGGRSEGGGGEGGSGEGGSATRQGEAQGLGQSVDLGRLLNRCAYALRLCLCGLPAAEPVPAKMVAGQLVYGHRAAGPPHSPPIAGHSPARLPRPSPPRPSPLPAAASTLPPRSRTPRSPPPRSPPPRTPRPVSTAAPSPSGSMRRSASLPPPAPVAPTRSSIERPSTARPAPVSRAASSQRAPVNEERFARFMAQVPQGRPPQGGVINRKAYDAPKPQRRREADGVDLSKAQRV